MWRRSEDANWTSSLKDFDESAMLDSVGAFAVEKPFWPTGACNNCFENFKIRDRDIRGGKEIRTHPKFSS